MLPLADGRVSISPASALKVAVVGPTHPYKGGVASHTTTLAHELAHHFARHQASGAESETEAEAVSYVVFAHHGLDAGPYNARSINFNVHGASRTARAVDPASVQGRTRGDYSQHSKGCHS